MDNIRIRLIGEVFEDLATEVIQEVEFLEDLSDLLPDVRTLSNINPVSRNEAGSNSVQPGDNAGVELNPGEQNVNDVSSDNNLNSEISRITSKRRLRKLRLRRLE